MKISIGCDHIVTEMKNHLVEYLTEKGHEVIDNGTHDKERTHYPIYGKKTSEKVSSGEADLGIVVCGTGVGISVSANKVKRIRAALVSDIETARYAKKHLNANVLAMGGRITGIGVIEEAIDTFLETEYEETEESKKLIEKIDSIPMNEDLIGDEHYFDEFIEKWNNGGYPAK
ncbi:galactose-6-phosphate isomerase subunit LacB [Lentibacillus sp. CBA3610]|uniref:galactose-6-phosphate isomerase subunit LacB n=1 Tax=Lentibacillus sp. CBA3610 TaxID=2518176 RepID=UPI001595BD41|nr:galactose-6-phosphate isomerase subunit LacB [Lentibacillus sp. CBA3610]QKY70363.1 galactose-6-phosphate isomerase subunit LacB [Lentibacillus sp. CBA3610]